MKEIRLAQRYGLFSASLTALCMSLVFIPAAHAAVQCQPSEKPPSIVVHVEVRQPAIDHTLSRNRLTQFDVATVSPYPNSHHVHVNGIMRGAIALETQSAIAWQHDGKGENNCFWYDQVQVTMRLNPTIYIANEIPYSSCLYREVMEHEYKHFNTDFQVTKDYQAVLERELSAMVRQTGVVGPFAGSLKMRPKDELLKRLEDRVAAISERMKQDRMQRQALIDTKEEYDRVAAACPQDIERIEREVRRSAY